MIRVNSIWHNGSKSTVCVPGCSFFPNYLLTQLPSYGSALTALLIETSFHLLFISVFNALLTGNA